MRRLALTLALACAASVPALAHPPGAPGGGWQRPEGPPMDRAQREKMLRKIHTMAVIELGSLLDLDTTGTIKLGERLQKYADQRVALRLENFDLVEQVRKLAHGEGSGDAPGLARRLAQNKVQLAQVDQAELNDLLQGLSPDKAAKVALFVAEFPRRIEMMAMEARHHGGPGGPGMGHGPMDE